MVTVEPAFCFPISGFRQFANLSEFTGLRPVRVARLAMLSLVSDTRQCSVYDGTSAFFAVASSVSNPVVAFQPEVGR